MNLARDCLSLCFYSISLLFLDGIVKGFCFILAHFYSMLFVSIPNQMILILYPFIFIVEVEFIFYIHLFALSVVSA